MKWKQILSLPAGKRAQVEADPQSGWGWRDAKKAGITPVCLVLTETTGSDCVPHPGIALYAISDLGTGRLYQSGEYRFVEETAWKSE